MLLMQHNQDGLRKRLHVIGIPNCYIEEFISTMCKWEQSSGFEWTIKRLKSLKVDLIRRRSNLQPLTWIRKNRKGDIAGVIGGLFRWSDKSERNFAKCLQAFMAYSFYIFPTTTESQERKFCDAVSTNKQHGLDEQFFELFTKTVKNAVRVRPISYTNQPLVVYQGSPGKKAPNWFGRKSIAQDQEILADVSFFKTDAGINLYGKYREIYSPMLKGLSTIRDRLDRLASNSQSLRDRGYETSQSPIRGGSIHFLQEPGGKLRSIASPFRIHQEALFPLGKSIYDLIQQLPWDCTFDQSKAHPHIQSCLRQGGEVFSTDLSSATDYFPLDLQKIALETIFEDPKCYIDLFVEISKSTWSSPLGDVEWTRGQPLGLYPSFGTFTLTHGLLLLHLAGGHYDNQFFVVGDDVVILDEDLNNKYRAVLDRMSCPWSPEKSISSFELSEFAGKVITADGVYPQLKWRNMSNDNFLDICRLLGKKSRCLLSPRQKKVFDVVNTLCLPIGLNFSYPGSNLSEMVYQTLSVIHESERCLASLMGLGRKFNALHYTSGEILDKDELLSISQTFDENVALVLSQTVFHRWSFLNSIDKEALETLPSALALDARLPGKIRKPTRSTELERYERMLIT